MKVHEIIRKIRRDLDLTQQNVAEALGVDLSTYNRYEKDSGIIQLKELEKIAKVFKMSVAEMLLIGEEPTMVKEPKMSYSPKKKVQVTVELDGDSGTLDYWFKMLKKFNAAIA